MAKKPDLKVIKQEELVVEKTKVLMLSKAEGAYGYIEVEIPLEALEKHGVILEMSNKDIFEIFMSNMKKKCRELFEI